MGDHSRQRFGIWPTWEFWNTKRLEQDPYRQAGLRSKLWASTFVGVVVGYLIARQSGLPLTGRILLAVACTGLVACLLLGLFERTTRSRQRIE